MASKLNKAFIKTIKFKENPNPEELQRQFLLVNDQFDVFYS